MATVVVVGAGVGGLAAAIRLRAAGHDVLVLERRPEIGGKLAVRRRAGFSFDIGPSLLTLPQVFDDLFRLAGTSIDEELRLVRLDPQFRYHFPDGSTFDAHDDPQRTAVAVDALAPGAGAELLTLLGRGGRIWDVSERTFFAGEMGSPRDLARRLRSPRDLVTIDPLRSLHRAGERSFHDPRLIRWLDRYATYSGSSPYRAPATLACIPAIESRYGCWHPLGGLGELAHALARSATRLGVKIRTGSEVERIDAAARSGPVTGCTLVTGERISADVVVANVDAGTLYRDLLPDASAARRVARAEPSSSGFVLAVGVDGTTPGLAHHTISFGSDYRQEFAQIFESGQPPSDPTIYICCSSLTDPSQAPTGSENWFVLVNTPSGGQLDWSTLAPRYRDHLLDVLAARGFDVSGRARFVETLTPADIAVRYRSPGGAIYGTSSNGRQAAFLRPGNRGPRPGLYLVGGSSHPGGGLPLVTISARIVADLVAGDLATRRRR